MTRIRFALGLVATLLVASACTDQQPPIQRVGPNIVDKSVFTDSWYYSRTVIDVDYEGSAMGTFPGDAAVDFVSGLTSLPRIRWIIDEDTLYAYRDYELVEGANGEPQQPGEVLGHPVAAFSIERHFDIRREYNPATGEEQNVIVENDFDRLWFERQYMRVSWEENLLPGFYGQTFDLFEIIGRWSREPAPLVIQDNSVFPETWSPQFHYMTCDGSDDPSDRCLDEDRDLADDYELGELYHMSFTTQEILSPGNFTLGFGVSVPLCSAFLPGFPACSSVAVYIRNSFLKVSDQREYEPVNYVDTRFERHGYFRLNRATFDRSTGPDDPAFGLTDFLNYSANRYNLWKQWTDESGAPLPYDEREVRPIVWYMTPETPAHIVKPFFEVVGEWNGILAETVRTLQGRSLPEYEPVACQQENPDEYCFCKFDEAGNILNPTCEGRYDPFTPPSEVALVSGEPIDCYVRMTDGSPVFGEGGAEPDLDDPRLSDSDFDGWFDTEMVGSECVTVLRQNTCNRASLAEAEASGTSLRCQERGDARFKFVSYVDQPGTRFLGIATLRGDPVTGEIITGDANVGGPAFDSYRTFALQTYDLERGNILEDPFIAGEDVRQYMEGLNRTDVPAVPLPARHVELLESPVANPEITRSIDNIMSMALPRMEALEGPEGASRTYTDRLFTLAQEQPDVERRMLSNPDFLAAAGFEQIPSDVAIDDLLTEDVLNKASPFRTNVNDLLTQYSETDDLVASRSMMMPNEYTDNSVTRYATDRARLGWNRTRLEFGLNRYLVFSTQLHEMGHCMGLRHSFASSADTANYHDDYYLIDAAYPLPSPQDPAVIDAIEVEVGDNRNGRLDTTNETTRFEEQYEEVRQRRRLAGISQTNSASIMEYMPEWYSDAPAHGRYDNAALFFGYGELVEVIDNPNGVPIDVVDQNGDPILGADGNPIRRADTLENPLNAERRWARYYMGGEPCTVGQDDTCPFAADGARVAELTQTNLDAGLTQTCEPHPNGSIDGVGVCSNFDQDAQALIGSDPTPRWAPVTYQFCTDNRASGGAIGSLGICNRWDDGENYREIVRNIAERYQRNYLFEAFRRYRRGYRTGSLAARFFSRRFFITQGIFQNMLFRYAEEPEFRDSTGPFGFYDQFFATVDILNLYARILGNPAVGSYSYVPQVDTYFWNTAELGGGGVDDYAFDVRVQDGGRYFESVFQEGLTGLQRVELVGNFLEKVFAMQLLTFRGWTPWYTRDTPFLLNMYDIFPLEMTQIIGGMIRNEPGLFAPRVQCAAGSAGADCEDPQVLYPDFYRGDCLANNPAGCRPAPQQTSFGDLPIVDGFRNGTLRSYAYIFGLAQFTTFFDTTFQNQVFVCVEGFADCPEPTADQVEGEDFVRFDSERFLASIIAYRAEVGSGAEGASIGFDIVTELRQADGLFRLLRKYAGDFDDGIPDLDRLTPEDRAFFAEADYPLPLPGEDVSSEIARLEGRAFELENFVNVMVQWQRLWGIQQIF